MVTKQILENLLGFVNDQLKDLGMRGTLRLYWANSKVAIHLMRDGEVFTCLRGGLSKRECYEALELIRKGAFLVQGR